MVRSLPYAVQRAIRVRSDTGTPGLAIERGRFALRVFHPTTRQFLGVVNAAREGDLPNGPLRPGSTSGLVWSAIDRAGARCTHQLTRSTALIWLLDEDREELAVTEDVTSRMLAKSDKMRRFRDLEEAAELSQREVRAGTRDAFGKPVTKRARPARPRNMTPADRVEPDTDAIVAAYNVDGLTVPEVAEAQGISQHTVYRHLKIAGIPLRAKTALPDSAELVRLYESGLSIREIADRFSATHHPVHQRLLAAGVTMRPGGARRSAA